MLKKLFEGRGIGAVLPAFSCLFAVLGIIVYIVSSFISGFSSNAVVYVMLAAVVVVTAAALYARNWIVDALLPVAGAALMMLALMLGAAAMTYKLAMVLSGADTDILPVVMFFVFAVFMLVGAVVFVVSGFMSYQKKEA